MGSIRAKIRAQTTRSNATLPLDEIVRRLNPILRGWGNYFRHGNSSQKFAALYSYVHMRMAMLASDKHGLSGRYWKTRFTRTWFSSLGAHRLSGTVAYRAAHASR
jgi:RNA-directed DNA polymerase